MVIPNRDLLVKTIGVYVTLGGSGTGYTGDTIRFGIYNASTIGTSGSLLGSQASVLGTTSSGMKTISLTTSIQLTAGTAYYVCVGLGFTAGLTTNYSIATGSGTYAAGFGTALGTVEGIIISGASTFTDTSTCSANTVLPYFVLRTTYTQCQ
jgi:hypothetical protein